MQMQTLWWDSNYKIKEECAHIWFAIDDTHWYSHCL